jgi:hypothetical protein
MDIIEWICGREVWLPWFMGWFGVDILLIWIMWRLLYVIMSDATEIWWRNSIGLDAPNSTIVWKFYITKWIGTNTIRRKKTWCKKNNVMTMKNEKWRISANSIFHLIWKLNCKFIAFPVYWRRTDNTMVKRKMTRTNNDLQNIHLKLKID